MVANAGLSVSTPLGLRAGLVGVVGVEGGKLIGGEGVGVSLSVDASIAPPCMLMVDEARRSMGSLANCICPFLENENPAVHTIMIVNRKKNRQDIVSRGDENNFNDIPFHSPWRCLSTGSRAGSFLVYEICGAWWGWVPDDDDDMMEAVHDDTRVFDGIQVGAMSRKFMLGMVLKSSTREIKGEQSRWIAILFIMDSRGFNVGWLASKSDLRAGRERSP
jgi:hypothetical protein